MVVMVVVVEGGFNEREKKERDERERAREIEREIACVYIEREGGRERDREN